MPSELHSWVEINLKALDHNLRLIRDRLSPQVTIMAVVKADAYGHGAKVISARLEELGIKSFGVANVNEAVTLREAGIKGEIFLLGGFFKGEEEYIITHELVPIVYDLESLIRLSEKARKWNKKLKVHLKVDTGMGRFGILPDKVKEFVEKINEIPLIELKGVASHFSTADEGDDFFYEQLRTFERIKGLFKKLGLSLKYHIANSSAIFSSPQSHFDMVRPGITLYGVNPSLDFKKRFSLPLKPLMCWKTRIVSIKEIPKGWPVSYGRTWRASRRSCIGIIPVGYADGYLRALSNRGWVLVKGKKVPVIGRVTMDCTIIDLTELPEARAGDEVILLGEEIPAEEVAFWASTIPYEVLCLAGKNQRIIKDEDV